MSIRITLLLLLFTNAIASGQQNYALNYSINNGLPSNTVRSIYKDTQNRMWIGTSAGLCRFDGKNFTVLGTANGLVGDNVFSITEDDRQNIWIGSAKGGISKYDGKSFTNYTVKNGLVNENVRVVWFSKKFSLLFVGTSDGCSVFDGKIFTSLTEKESKIKGLYVMGFLDGDDCVNIYTYSPDYYYRYTIKTGLFSKIKSPGYSGKRHSTSPLILANGDTVVTNGADGICVLNQGIKKIFPGSGQVFDIRPDFRGNVWLACFADYTSRNPGGLYFYDGETVKSYSERFGITDRSVWALYYDSAYSQLWVGTLNEGLYKVPLTTFDWYNASDLGLEKLNVKSLFLSKNNALWIGARNSLIIRDPAGKLTTLSNKQLMEIWGPIPPHASLEFSCISDDSHGNVYVSNSQNSLIQFSASAQYKNPRIYKVIPGATVFCFDSHDSLYYSDKWWNIVFISSFYSPNPEADLFDRHPNLPIPHIGKIISSDDAVWFSSKSEGLFMRSKGKLFQFSKIDQSLPLIINDICFDGQGNVVVGSNSGEVLIVNYSANKGLVVKHRLLPGKDIKGNTVKFIIADHRQHLFIGTNLGLNRIDLKALYQDKKVISNFFNGETGYFDNTGKVAELDQEGNIWVGTDNHLLRINTKMLDLLTDGEPNIHIDRLEVNFQDFPGYTDQLALSHEQNNLIFHFKTVNYLNPQQTLYRYKLSGLSERWSDFSTESKAVFTSLNPGSYRLIVEGYNTINSSKTGRLEYKFSIGYPWYLTWWFLVMAFLSLGFAIRGGIVLKTRKIRQEEKKKTEFSRQLAGLEIRALQSQMNPHFIFNSINSIQGFILKNKVDEALGYLMDFSKILRQTLDNASRELISLEEELQYIRYYLSLEMMRFDQKFEVEINFPESINPQSVQLPPMILQPYVENAIRHGLLHKQDGKGKLHINFTLEADIFKCTIEDNGVGRTRAGKIESWKQPNHKPKSTRITQDRIDLMNQSLETDKCRIITTDLTDKNGNVTGTRVEIILLLMIG